MNYAEINDRHVRLAILRVLAGAPEYSGNDSVLSQAVQQLGLQCTRDQMRGHLGWLEEQRAVTLVHPAPGLIVATITERGADLAAGRSIIPGVQKPSPGAGI